LGGPLGLTDRDVIAGFQPDIENITTNVVAEPSPDRTGWQVRGDSTLGTDLVAKFTRSLFRKSNGDLVAYHIRLDVDPFFQDLRYATRLLKASFALYQRIGVSYVQLDAVGDGTIVWPRMGWSLHGQGIATVHDEISRCYIMRHGAAPPVDFPLTMFGPDVLELQDEAQNRLGEEALTNLARSHQEISMRLYLDNDRALAALHRRGIV
jgi:GNAT superfamily N-acetyltransferase